jgi:hypothetical protein
LIGFDQLPKAQFLGERRADAGQKFLIVYLHLWLLDLDKYEWFNGLYQALHFC